MKSHELPAQSFAWVKDETLTDVQACHADVERAAHLAAYLAAFNEDPRFMQPTSVCDGWRGLRWWSTLT